LWDNNDAVAEKAWQAADATIVCQTTGGVECHQVLQGVHPLPASRLSALFVRAALSSSLSALFVRAALSSRLSALFVRAALSSSLSALFVRAALSSRLSALFVHAALSSSLQLHFPAVLSLPVRKAKATETWCIFDKTARHAAWDDALQFLHALRALPDS
jgi:hypothetical protein